MQDVYCGDCRHLNMTEDKQDRMGWGHKDHICNKYNVRVRHYDKHPNLLRLEVCRADKTKEANK